MSPCCLVFTDRHIRKWRAEMRASGEAEQFSSLMGSEKEEEKSCHQKSAWNQCLGSIPIECALLRLSVPFSPAC